VCWWSDTTRFADSANTPNLAGWGPFRLAYKADGPRCFRPNPPTGRVGILHAGLQSGRARVLPAESPNLPRLCKKGAISNRLRDTRKQQ